MKPTLSRILMQLAVASMLITACKKNDDIKPPNPPSQPTQPTPTPIQGFFAVKVKAAITVGDVVYDSIPATFSITTWNENGEANRKDTALNAGAQVIYLPKTAKRYSLKLQKWGVTDEKTLNKAEVTEGALYQLGGHKEAKKLQWVTEYRFEHGSPVLFAKKHFIYDAQGRINEVQPYAPDPNDGVLRSNSSDLYLFDGHELWVNNTSKSDGTVYSHTAFVYDAQGRTIQTRYQYLTEQGIFTNQYTNEGILMSMGRFPNDPNGTSIALKFAGGNRVEEITTVSNQAAAVKKFRFDFNINPYVINKMPSLYFEQSSKNNIVAEGWDGSDRFIYEYKYDADGFVTEVITKARNNNGQFENYSKTVYTY